MGDLPKPLDKTIGQNRWVFLFNKASIHPCQLRLFSKLIDQLTVRKIRQIVLLEVVS